jgi:hypothetical protein
MSQTLDRGIPFAIPHGVFETSQTLRSLVMRAYLFVLVGTTLLAFVGCHNYDSPKGGPGKEGKEKTTTTVETGPSGTEVRKETTIRPDEDTSFKIHNPGTVSLRQGESKAVTVALDRGRKFTQPVTVTLRPDAGITVTPDKATIAGGDSKTEFMVAAGAAATVGSHSVEITGTPTTGDQTSLKFAVEVKEKK